MASWRSTRCLQQARLHCPVNRHAQYWSGNSSPVLRGMHACHHDNAVHTLVKVINVSHERACTLEGYSGDWERKRLVQPESRGLCGCGAELAAAAARGQRILGVCFGCQIMALALGGKAGALPYLITTYCPG